jgi:hypothetical protein
LHGAAPHFAEGDRCGKDDLLLELEPEEPSQN